MTEAAPRLALTTRGLDEIMFWRGATPIRGARFLGDVAALAARLPDRPHALNLCRDRYHFLVAFAAALTRGQVSLLTSERGPYRLRELTARHPDVYALSEPDDAPPDLAHVAVADDAAAPEWQG